ncbi:DMT family transporter [Sungkyunkwania multivorans]|uniref:DMT family transporter n=1 Tax=Sungkyunkwania multivorans TaxID=1173618 RepID=A0ABW3CZ99_9FLAO
MRSISNLTFGFFLGILGIVMFSSKAVMVKLAYAYEIDAIGILLLRMAFSFPFYLVIAIIYTPKGSFERHSIQIKDYLWVFFFGFVGYYLASYFDFVGLSYIKASLERIILFVYPTLVLLMNRLFLKIPISKAQALAIAITYLGVVITFWEEVAISGRDTYLGGVFVLLSAITYASYLVGSGWMIPKFGVMRFTAYAMIVSCLCVFVHYALTANVDIFQYSWEVYLLGLLIAVFATVIPSFLVSASIKMINASNFAIVAGIGPISTIIFASIFLNEQLTVLQLIGAMVVIIGILLVSRNRTSKIK